MGLKEEIEKTRERAVVRAYHAALDGLVHSVETDEILKKNEKEANVFTSIVMLFLGGVFLLIAIADYMGFFHVDVSRMTKTLILAECFFCIPSCVTLFFRKTQMYMRYFLMTNLILGYGIMAALLTYNVVLVLVIPVIISCRYCTRAFTVFSALFTTIVFFLSSITGVYRYG